MGAALVLNTGAILLTEWELGLGSAGSSTQKVGLITAPISPTASSVYSDFTLGAGDGLDPVTIVNGTWQTPTIVSGKATSVYGSPTPFTWTYTGAMPVSIYGYLAYDVAAPTGMWCEIYGTVRVLNSGDGLSEQLTFSGGAC